MIVRVLIFALFVSVCVTGEDTTEDEGESENEAEEEPQEIPEHCTDHEIFTLTELASSPELEFSGKAACTHYEKIFQFNPDTDAMRGHVLTVAEVTGQKHLSFIVSEFTLSDNGTIMRTLIRPGEIVGGHTWFAPTTGILIQFTREGGQEEEGHEYSFRATITNTPTNHHCPYPFIDLHPDEIYWMPDTLIEYYCDAIVTAPPGYDVRIDHISEEVGDSDLVIRVWDEEKNELEFLESFPVKELLPGANPIVLDIANRGKHSHHVEIQVSAVKLNCDCPPRLFTFNNSKESTVFQSPDYPKAHCRMISCQTTFFLPVELRQKYRMKLDRFDILAHGVIEIDQGASGITTQNDRMTRTFTFESPNITMKYLPEGKRYGDVYSIPMTLIERQEGCDCPAQPAPEAELSFGIPAKCKQMDCLYELPQFDDNTVRYYNTHDATNDYIGSRRAGETSDRYSYDAGEGTYEFDSWANRDERMIIRFHRENPTPESTEFIFRFTTSGRHVSHAERCKCGNETIVLESNQTTGFTSPDWPGHYCNNLACVMTYVAPMHHHLEVKLSTISLEPNVDRVAFFEGTNTSAKHIELVTGELLISDTISSIGSIMTTVFISNGAVSFYGFNGTITAVMDKTWADHLKHHISAWWWLIAICLLTSISGAALFVWRRGGLRRSNSINLMDL